MTAQEAREFAEHWIASWNSHDLEAILSHYAPEVTLTSPAARSLLNQPSGTVSGKGALRNYFERGLEAYPNLRFLLQDVLLGVTSVVVYYTNQTSGRTAEYMEIGPDGKVVRVVANYNA